MTRVDRWERRTEIPLLLLAIAFLVAFAWPILDPRLDTGLAVRLTVVSWTVWAAFALDFLIRIVLAEERVSYIAGHWYDVALIALPMLRPLRLLRLLALVRVLDRSAANSLAGRAVVYVSGAAALTTGLAALAVLDAERGAPKANIQSFGDALWWAGSTVTTAGAGELFPVTTTGRIVAFALMMVGIGLVGTVIASMSSWILARTEHPAQQS